MADMNKIRERSEIPVEDTWATEDLYATDAAWEEELAQHIAQEVSPVCQGCHKNKQPYKQDGYIAVVGIQRLLFLYALHWFGPLRHRSFVHRTYLSYI
mgnify:CR=1 FL=1